MNRLARPQIPQPSQPVEPTAPAESRASEQTPVAFVKRLADRFQAWTIERRVLAGFSLVFAGILVISAVSYRNMIVLIRNSHLDTRSHELLDLLDVMGTALDEAESGLRRFLITGEESYLEPHRTVASRIPEYSRYLQELTTHDTLQRERAETIQRLMRKQLTAEEAAIQLRDTQPTEDARQVGLSGPAKAELEMIHRLQAAMEHDENQGLQRRLLESAATTRHSIVLLGIGALLLFVLLASVYYLIRHDVTERRRVAFELRHRGELLEAANRELEAFSYSVSHDLRAPLRHIDGYASLLEKAAQPVLDDKAKRYLQTISESAKRMGQLIDDLLVFSRMGRQEMLRTRVNLDQLIKSVLHDLRHDLQGRVISWTIAPLPEVQGDPAMLRQVFFNLIANAVKFTESKAAAEIQVGSELRHPREVVVFVKDNGVGFDMQYASKLFGVFQRLHRADEFEGTGIGLANVRRIIHRHGGRVWAEGALDRGATFYLSLPIERR